MSADLPMAGWKLEPESGGHIGLMRNQEMIYLAARSNFAPAAAPCSLSYDEAKLLHETLGKMLAPMKRPKLIVPDSTPILRARTRGKTLDG